MITRPQLLLLLTQSLTDKNWSWQIWISTLRGILKFKLQRSWNQKNQFKYYQRLCQQGKETSILLLLWCLNQCLWIAKAMTSTDKHFQIYGNTLRHFPALQLFRGHPQITSHLFGEFVTPSPYNCFTYILKRVTKVGNPTPLTFVWSHKWTSL